MCTRPDIYYVVKMVSLYLENPGIMRWKAVKSILRYLKGTKDYSLCYQGKKLCLVGYSDANWVGDLDERKLAFGYIYIYSCLTMVLSHWEARNTLIKLYQSWKLNLLLVQL